MDEGSNGAWGRLDGLLKEIASDPDATLLRRAGSVPIADGSDLWSGVSPRMAGLVLAERHLLQAHREELGVLLRFAAREAVLRDETHAASIWRYDQYKREVPRTSVDVLGGRARWLRDRGAWNGLDEGVRAVIEVIAGERDWSRVPAMDVALAGLRVLPSDASRNIVVHVHRLNKDWGPAERIIRSVLDNSPSPLARSRVLIARGQIQASRKDLHGALLSFQTVVRTSPFVDLAAMNMLGVALRTGRVEACREAAVVIDAELEGHRDAVDSFAREIRQQRRLGMFDLEVPDRRLLDSGFVGYRPTSMGVVDAYA